MSHVAHVGDVLAMHARMYPDKVGARDLEREMTFRIWYNRACRLAIGNGHRRMSDAMVPRNQPPERSCMLFKEINAKGQSTQRTIS